MGLKDMLPNFKMGRKDEEDVMEVPEDMEPTQKINVRIENLGGMVDADRISKLLKEGNIVFLKTRELQKRDLGEFQLTVQKLKRMCTNFGFDLVGTEEGYLLMTPKFAQIMR